MSASRPIGTVSRETLLAQDGLSFLRDVLAGKHPAPPMAETLDFALVEVDAGRAVFEGTPQWRHYNPLGVVHGGYAATLLDSALGCTVQTTCRKGEAYTTLELKVNLVRALTSDVGPVRASGRIIHRGRSTATAEADLRDASDRLYAHATTTCLIMMT